MSNKYNLILTELSTNPWTALVTLIDGSVHAIRVDFDPTSARMDEFFNDMHHKYGECSIRLMPKREMTESELQREIDEAVNGLELSRGIDVLESHQEEIKSELEKLGLTFETASGKQIAAIVEKFKRK